MLETQETIYKDIPELRRVEVPDPEHHRTIKSYVLRCGYLHTSDVENLKQFYPSYGLPYSGKVLDYEELFHNDKPVILEIGFGMGDTTFRIAQERNQYNYIASEVFITGFAKLMGMVGNAKLDNIKLIRFDAVTVLKNMIRDDSLAGIHIFFPDPWQKTRQNKRRLIQKPFAELIMKKLKQDGYVYAVTDWQPYAEQMIEVFEGTEGLENPYEKYATQRKWRPTTHFEQKGMKAERQIHEVWFVKK